MIFGGQIAFLLIGLFVIVSGRFSLGRGKSVRGGKARILGVICLLPIPLAFGVGLVLGFSSELVFQRPPTRWFLVLLEALIFFAILLFVMYTADRLAEKQ